MVNCRFIYPLIVTNFDVSFIPIYLIPTIFNCLLAQKLYAFGCKYVLIQKFMLKLELQHFLNSCESVLYFYRFINLWVLPYFIFNYIISVFCFVNLLSIICYKDIKPVFLFYLILFIWGRSSVRRRLFLVFFSWLKTISITLKFFILILYF